MTQTQSNRLKHQHGQAIIQQPIEALLPYKNNARIHSKAQIKQVMSSIERFGFTNPVLVSKDKMIIAGHARVEAAHAADPDARDQAAYQALMQGEQANLIFTDPPYNVPIDKHVCGLGQIKHREFAFASGVMRA